MDDEAVTRVLVVDDEENIRHLLQLLLQREGFAVEVASHAQEALEKIEQLPPQIILCDIRMPGSMDGLGLLEYLFERGAESEVIMMSAYGSRQTAIEAVRKGAYDYIDKPIKRDDLLLTLQKLQERERLRQENRRLRAALDASHHEEGIIAHSEAMLELLQLSRKVAAFPTTVLLQGESGTGKELLAQAIHRWSERRDRPFVPINCGSIPEPLLESELFGYARGAFTGAMQEHKGLFEAAHQGTLFLDEVAELPLPLQVKLLRTLQEGSIRRLGETTNRPINVRILAATNRDLEEEVQHQRFREDLFYRLNVFTLQIPPLGERPEDIPPLLEHFLERFNARYGTTLQGITPEAMRVLTAYHWPGNVRELKNVVERSVVLEESSWLTLAALPPELTRASDAPSPPSLPPFSSLSIKKAVRQLEKDFIRRALEKTEGNRSAAARLLEISHRTLLYKIKEYNIQ